MPPNANPFLAGFEILCFPVYSLSIRFVSDNAQDDKANKQAKNY